MKKLGLMLMVVGLTVTLASSLKAQNVDLSLVYEGLLPNPKNMSENLMAGATILIMATLNDAPSGTDVSQAYFAASGDTVLPLLSTSTGDGFLNPTVYWGDLITAFPNTIPVGNYDLTGYSLGDQVHIFARVISNTSGMTYPDLGLSNSWDAAGNYVKNAEGTTDLSNVYYFDTEIFTFAITDPPGSANTALSIPVVTDMGDWSADGATPYTWTPVMGGAQAVPEPGAMMLMAGGMLFLVRKIKK